MNEENAEYMITISKDELALLPIAHFCGDIKVIDSSDDVDAAIDRLRASDIIGFDTETKPSFKRGQTNLVSLIQLSTPDTCFLFRINLTGMPLRLKELLEDDAKLKVGLSLRDDFHNLAKVCDLEPRGFIDLQQYVKNVGISDNSLSRIYAILFGKRISKGQRLSNWEAQKLSPGQQQYAALDAQACIDIYRTINEGAFNPLESPYRREVTHEDNALPHES